MKYPVVSSDPRVQALYVKCRKNLRAQAKREGKPSDASADHRFAEMLAFHQAPRSLTDREFYQGMGTLADQFKTDPQHLQTVTAAAQRRGYRPNPNDVYVPTLAREPGDPMAFISPSGGRGELKKRAEALGVEGNGVVKTRGRAPTEDPLKRQHLAPDVMNQLVAHEARKAKREGRKMTQGEIKEKVLANHRYKM